MGGVVLVMTKPTAAMIPPNAIVEVMMLCLLGMSLVHRQQYGLMLPATMVSEECDVSGGTEAEKGGSKAL
jgi:hypothetical protein